MIEMVRKEIIETKDRSEARRNPASPSKSEKKEAKVKVPNKMTAAFRDKLLLKVARKLDLVEE